jgi:hypothetical protein
VKSLSAQYMNELQSDLRGIKIGWYAINGSGGLSFGPFFNRETCLTRINQFNIWSISSQMYHRPT